jgi:hypothetical protein
MVDFQSTMTGKAEDSDLAVFDAAPEARTKTAQLPPRVH